MDDILEGDHFAEDTVGQNSAEPRDEEHTPEEYAEEEADGYGGRSEKPPRPEPQPHDNVAKNECSEGSQVEVENPRAPVEEAMPPPDEVESERPGPASVKERKELNSNGEEEEGVKVEVAEDEETAQALDDYFLADIGNYVKAGVCKVANLKVNERTKKALIIFLDQVPKAEEWTHIVTPVFSDMNSDSNDDLKNLLRSVGAGTIPMADLYSVQSIGTVAVKCVDGYIKRRPF